MRTKLSALLALIGLLLAGCGAAPTPQTIIKEVVVTPTASPDPEAVIQGVEPGAEITFWTFWLSPTFDDYIQGTLARFHEVYPGVQVNWEDHQATFQDDLTNAFTAGKAPDVINLSVGEGWVSDYATRGLLLPLDDAVPAAVKELYFVGLWREQLVQGVNYQFPWYQGINVDLVNRQIYDQTGLTLEDFPKTVDGLPALCKTIKEKTGTLCDIRLTVNDLPSQMVYEGGVKFISDDGTKFTFASKEAAAWLQMYVDMVRDGTVDQTVLLTDQDRVGLDLFTSGGAAFYATGPNLIRDVRQNNPGLYGYLAVVPAPVGKSGVLGKGLMGISIKKDTAFPNASIALAQFFTNPKSMLEFSKVVAVYPSTPSSFDDPFFSTPSLAIEDGAKRIAKDVISTYADIVPTIPHKAEVNQILLEAIRAALFSGADPATILSEAAARANALLP